MVGAHLVCTMLRQGFDVRATKCPCDNTEYTKNILSLYSDDYENLYNEIEWVDADYDDPESMASVMEGVCVAFCCIQPTLTGKVSISHNVERIRNIAAAVRDSECEYMMYLSSVYALGEEPDLNDISEKSQRNPKGKYTKMSDAYYQCEMEVWRAMQEGLKAGIINAASVIGPGDWKFDRSKFVSNALMRNYYTDGVSGFVSINDLVKCIMAMAKQRICNENFVACGHNLCCKDLIYLFAKGLHADPPSRKASRIRIMFWKMRYAMQSLMEKRRPIVDDEFFHDLTQFRTYDNSKSINRIIISYEPIEDTINMVCALREKSLALMATSSK
ncbi:MAG: NAD-dependent epimerase/dehydratase family protein [Bacteroidales bacterium]|nr:NAD-dependent epimerase/dehydratase family protein [Bacteroidales bacterium]